MKNIGGLNQFPAAANLTLSQQRKKEKAAYVILLFIYSKIGFLRWNLTNSSCSVECLKEVFGNDEICVAITWT